MEIINTTIEELNAAICAAVNAALNEREKQKKNVLISREAVVEQLHVNASTLWRWERAGYLHGTKIGRRKWYSKEAIENLKDGEISI